MVVEIKPEDEKLIALSTGAFRSVDELIHHALVSLNRTQTLPEFLENSPLAGLRFCGICGAGTHATIYAEGPVV